MMSKALKISEEQRSKGLVVLQEMKRLLATHDRWTRYVLARNEDLLICAPSDPKAYSFCLIGAQERALQNCHITNKWAVDQAICKILHEIVIWELGFPTTSGLSYFNDTSRYTEVMHLIDRAIYRFSSTTE